MQFKCPNQWFSWSYGEFLERYEIGWCIWKLGEIDPHIKSPTADALSTPSTPYPRNSGSQICTPCLTISFSHSPQHGLSFFICHVVLERAQCFLRDLFNPHAMVLICFSVYFWRVRSWFPRNPKCFSQYYLFRLVGFLSGFQELYMHCSSQHFNLHPYFSVVCTKYIVGIQRVIFFQLLRLSKH